MTDFLAFLRAEHARHPWMLPGVSLTGAAALGTALPDLIAWVLG